MTARQTLTPTFEGILTRLVAILGLISKNPSNPRFDQFIFESISGLMKYVVFYFLSTSAKSSKGLSSLETCLRFQRLSRLCLDPSPSYYNRMLIVSLFFLVMSFHANSVSRCAEYIPYVFQVLAQMLEFHTTEVPEQYRSLLPFLLTPAVWQQKGSIPGLVKLLKAFLAKDGAAMFAAGQVASVLAVVQQRLIPSKINDAWGFELLHSVVLNIKP